MFCPAQSLWDHLEPGPYAVGFQSSLEIDTSRREISLDPSQKLIGFRPVLVAVWYPSVRTTPGIKYAEFQDLDIQPDQPELKAFSRKLKNHSQESGAKILFSYDVNPPSAKEKTEALSRLLQVKSKASRRAPFVPGKFPVIFYCPGAEGSFDENVILFEYLASHGYVVISSAFQVNTTYVKNNIHLGRTIEKDLYFLIQHSSKLPFVDSSRLAAIGHSMGAQELLKFIGEQDCPLQSLISLDTTLETTFSKLQQKESKDFVKGTKESISRYFTQLRELSPPSIPVMLIASKRNNPDFSIFSSYLKHSSRYEVITSHLRHEDYISQGAQRSILPFKTKEQQQELTGVQNEYAQVCQLVLLFLDQTLKSDPDSKEAFTRFQKMSELLIRFQPAQP